MLNCWLWVYVHFEFSYLTYQYCLWHHQRSCCQALKITPQSIFGDLWISLPHLSLLHFNFTKVNTSFLCPHVIYPLFIHNGNSYCSKQRTKDKQTDGPGAAFTPPFGCVLNRGYGRKSELLRGFLHIIQWGFWGIKVSDCWYRDPLYKDHRGDNSPDMDSTWQYIWDKNRKSKLETKPRASTLWWHFMSNETRWCAVVQLIFTLILVLY